MFISKILFSLLTLTLIYSCANVALHVQPTGISSTRFLSHEEVLDFTSEQIAENMTRSTNLFSGPADDSYFEIIPETGAYLYADKREELTLLAAKDKWPQEKLAKSLADIRKQIAKQVKEQTCFIAHLRTSEIEHFKDEKKWSAKLETASGKKVALTFSHFGGAEGVQSVVPSYNYNSFYSTQSNQYLVYSWVCAKENVDLTQGFKLIIDPHFSDKSLPFELSWNLTK